MEELPSEGEPREEVEERDEAGPAKRRLRGFLNHLIIYFSAMILLVPINFLLTPGRVWFVFPLVAWGAPLAIHAAFAMGLFDRLKR